MPLRDLLKAIEAEADEESARLRQGAEAEAEAILSGARSEAARTRERILRAHAPATENEANRRVALARLEADRLRREARDLAFRRLLEEARDRLAGTRAEPGYRETLRALLAEALAALPDAAIARVDPGDVDLASDLSRELSPELTVTPEPGIGGGVVLESVGGRVVRNTFGARLANAEPRLRPWYGRRLGALSGSVPGSAEPR